MKQLVALGKTIAVAESITGGRLGDLITSVPGSSDAFLGGFVTYTNEMKQSQLHVSAETIGQFGAISHQTSLEMARGVLQKTDASYAVALTGNAGPSGAEGKPVGLAYVCVISRSGESIVRELNLHGDRDTIKQRAVKQALYSIWAVINNQTIE